MLGDADARLSADLLAPLAALAALPAAVDPSAPPLDAEAVRQAMAAAATSDAQRDEVPARARRPARTPDPRLCLWARAGADRSVFGRGAQILAGGACGVSLAELVAAPEGAALVARCAAPTPPPPSRTNWTRLVPPSVLTGHVSSLLLY